MKQFIVLAASLPLILIFLVQFTLDQSNYVRMGLLEDMVNSAKEEAKQEGCFTEDIQQKLIHEICDTFDLEESELEFSATDSPVYRVYEDNQRGLIYYRVSVPIGEIMAGKRLFGIRDEDNELVYTLESYAASELLESPGGENE